MEQSTELRNLTLRFYKAFSSGDHSFVARLFSPRDGVLVIGTDPNEWWTGYKTISNMLKAQAGEMSGITFVEADPQAYSEGTVGWVADRFKFRMPDGSEIPCRLTGVFHQESGEWKIVQWHGSIGISNEEAIGRKLTTSL